jgi:TRAP transporter TAXI family solute receptor
MRRRELGSLALASLLAAAGCHETTPVPRSGLILVTGSVGGVYDELGTALAAVAGTRFGLPIRAVRTAASVRNLDLLGDRVADLGFTTVDCAALAMAAELPFTAPVPVSALAAVYEDYLQLVVRKDSRFRRISDLAGHRVSTGEAGSGTAIAARRALSAAGIGARVATVGVPVSVAVRSLAERRLEAFFFSAGIPTPAITELLRDEVVEIRLLPLGDLIGSLQARYGEVYNERTIPRITYRTARDISTIGITNVLVVHRDMPDALARRLTKLLFAARPELRAAHADANQIDPRSALATYPVPLHPGAERYYRTIKLSAG